MIAIELNSCAGGMALGARAAGIEFAVAVDWDPDACATYERGLGRRPLELDIRALVDLVRSGWLPVERVDLLVADPPCTPWSRGGKRKGLADERDLILETVDLIGLLRPRTWLIGNVPGLDDGPNVITVQKTIGQLADRYRIDFVRLDAADYGVAQHRVRPFWFGRPIDSEPIRWPRPTHGDPRRPALPGLGVSLPPWVTVQDALGHLTEAELGQPIRVRWKRKDHEDHRLSTTGAPARTITRNTHTDGALLANERHPISRPDAPAHTIATKANDRGAQGGGCVTWPWDRPSTVVHADERIAPPGHHKTSFLSAPEAFADRPSTTVTARDEVGAPGRNGRDGTSQSTHAIKLTERAALILQGFPDGYWIAGKTKCARWSQIGQAMPPPLAAAVFHSIARWFAGHKAPICASSASTYPCAVTEGAE